MSVILAVSHEVHPPGNGIITAPTTEKTVRGHLLFGTVLLLNSFLAISVQAQGGEFLPDEELLEAQEEDFDPQEILERLLELRRRPLDPNKASFSQFQQIPYLSALQIRGILNFRKKGMFENLEDLLQVPGMDPATLARVSPFLKIRAVRKRWGHLRTRLALTLPRAQGYQQKVYRGDPTKTYLRLDLAVDEHLRLGALAEKDPGEKDLTDYRSLYLRLEHIGPLRQAIVGNFALEFGQGLVLWTHTGPSGGIRSPITVKRSWHGVRPYTSTDENIGLSGVALTSGLGPLELSLFFSSTPLDASLEEGGARSFYQSGYHRTEGEMEKKDALREILVGGHLSGRLSQDKIVGLTWYRSRYRPGLAVPDFTRNRYAFRGEISQVWGGHFDMIFGPVDLFGEMASNQRRVAGAILGFLLNGEGLRTSLVWRRYPPEFCNPHGSGLAEKDGQNESGMLLGLAWRPRTGTRLELLVSQHRRRWRSYLLEMPSAGEKWLVQIVQRLGSRTTLTLRHRERRGEVAAASALGARKNVRRHKSSQRFQLDWEASQGVEVRGRLETSRVSVEMREAVERGALLLAQMKLTPSRTVSLRGFVAFFHASSYDSRLYVCEVGPWGVARNVALFGRGSRAFFLVRFKIIRELELSARFCSTHYDDRQSMGDGLEERKGNVKREVLVQLDWRW